MNTAEQQPLSTDKNGRYRRILFFFGSAILQVIIFDLLLGRIPVLGGQIRATRPRRLGRWARRFRLLALDMGGVMIKLGQFLSARVDVLPIEITDELKDLQDEVPPVESARMFAVLQAELGDWRERFADIEQEPLAAASLGQAYRAWLLSPTGGQGERVVVKIQRPSIEEIVRIDLAALDVVARWLMYYRPIGRRADVPALMKEFAVTLWEELDYFSEADNAERFAAMYADNPAVRIPIVYREHTASRVIVLEDVTALKITDIDSLTAAGINPQSVTDRLLDIYFRQVFIEGFFHADPHPGNMFIQPLDDLEEGEERPFQITFIDFGMVGRVPDLMGDNLRKVIVSVIQRDAHQLTQAYQDLGFFLPGADLDRIAEAQETVLNRIWGRNLLELATPDPAEVQELGLEFRDLLFEFPFQIPLDFIYLGRAIGMVSGLVSSLNPEINPWYHLEKFGEELLRSKEARSWSKDTLVDILRPYWQVPGQLRQLLTDLERGRLRVQTIPDYETQRRLKKTEKKLSQLNWSILGAASIVSATMIYINKKGRGSD